MKTLKQASAEDLDSLQHYLTLSPSEKGEELARGFTVDFSNFITQEYPDLVQFLSDEDDYIEDYSSFPPAVLVEFLDNYADTCLSNDPAYAPTFLTVEFRKRLTNAWLVHFTDHPEAIAHDGFKFGMDRIDNLSLTTYFKDEAKKYGGYNFAMQPGERNLQSIGKNYGKHCVLFQADGVDTYHYGDEFDQVIFWGEDARNIIPIYSDYDNWTVYDQNENELFTSDDLRQVLQWAITNQAKLGKTASFPKLTPQEMETEAAAYQDQFSYEPPAGGPASNYVWHQDDKFPVANLDEPDEGWKNWLDQEKQWAAEGGRPDQYFEKMERWWTTNPDEPMIVVQGTDGKYYVWEGTHRQAIAKVNGMQTVPALVGTPKAKRTAGKKQEIPYVPTTFVIEVPRAAREHFWEEPPEGNLEFWAFKDRPRAFVNEPIIFTFDRRPVAHARILKIEDPGHTKCEQTGKYEKHHKVFWSSQDFKKYNKTGSYMMPPDAEAIIQKYEAQGMEIYLSAGNRTMANWITINTIVVPKDKRKQGIGTAFMQEITAWADRADQIMVLSPSIDHGATSVGRLQEFYGRFGFHRNKGRNKDFRTRETMIRRPNRT